MVKKTTPVRQRGTFDKTWEKIAFVLILGGAAYERRATIGMELFVGFIVLVLIILALNALFDRGRRSGSFHD